MDKIYKLFLTLSLSVFGFSARAEVYQRPLDQNGSVNVAEDVGCDVVTSTGTLEPVVVLGANSLYWVMTSSFQIRGTETTPGALTPSSFFTDIKNATSTTHVANFSLPTSSGTMRVYMSSATQPVINAYKPPLVFSDGFSLQTNTTTVIVSACYLHKSSSTATKRVASAVDTRGHSLKNSDAGCIPTTVDFGSAPVTMLISSVSAQASTQSIAGNVPMHKVFAPSSPNGTLFYWVSAASAPSAASANMLFQLGTSTPTPSHLALPGLVFDNPVGNTRYAWDPPWRSTSTISYSVPVAGGPMVTFCTRSIKETVNR